LISVDTQASRLLTQLVQSAGLHYSVQGEAI